MAGEEGEEGEARGREEGGVGEVEEDVVGGERRSREGKREEWVR